MIRKSLPFLSLLVSLAAILKPALASAASNCVKLGVAVLPGRKEVCGDPAQGGVIVAYLKIFLQFLSAGVGVVIVLMLVIAGIQYITSAGDPGSIKGAKERIVNAITALVLFILGFAILNFLIPGGIFR